jgi:hypothetical protein
MAVDKFHSSIPVASEDDFFIAARMLFEEENKRRNTVEDRATTVLSAAGVTGTLIGAVGGNVLRSATGNWSYVVLVLYVIALLYLVMAAVNALSVQRRVPRHTLGPLELLPNEAEVSYKRHLAEELISLTIENYKVNNRFVEALVAAQGDLRNGLIVVVLGGLFLPLT